MSTLCTPSRQARENECVVCSGYGIVTPATTERITDADHPADYPQPHGTCEDCAHQCDTAHDTETSGGHVWNVGRHAVTTRCIRCGIRHRA